MAFDANMADAVSGQPASAAEYNKVKNNVLDLNTRVGTTASPNALGPRADALEAIVANSTTGNTALGSRVTTVENKVTASSAAPGEAASALDAQFNTTSTTFTSNPTGGALPYYSFVAPASGRVLLLISGEVWSSAAGLAKLSCAVKNAGGTADVVAASNLHSLSKYNNNSFQGTKARLVTGLTPGTTYRAQLQLASRESNIAAYCANPGIIVVPQM